MKTRTWILLFLLFAAVCGSLTAAFALSGGRHSHARVSSDGHEIMTLDLSQDGEYRIEYGQEWNLLRVENGKVSVAAASCASQDCVHRPAADRGAPIVCLPNRMVIEFTNSDNFDAILQ